MNRLAIIIACCIAITSCKQPISEVEKYNSELSKLIFTNKLLSEPFNKVFDLSDPTYKAFKVLVSRRDRFVRITIYGLLNKEEFSEYPSSYFIYKSKVFLCYNGSEVIYSKTIDSVFINELKTKMISGVINDSRVFQFDIDFNKKIKLHIPAINPYDFNLDSMKTIRFPPPSKRK